MFTIFREGGKDSPVSMRRVLAFFFALASVYLAAAALPYASVGWYVFLPAGLSVAAVLLLLFFTTWADVVSLVQAARKGG